MNNVVAASFNGTPLNSVIVESFDSLCELTTNLYE